ncbi:MAG TPA: cellulose binding domain-containing protein, partial [Rugosimonospora sp.]|nr:cellulose binding domain-containing protein [Rugosimonospora sp.]
TVTATFSKDSDWGTGYQAKYTITNGTSASISSWTVSFDLPSGLTFGTYWDALVTVSGQHVTATNRNYNGTVAAGASTSFGFIVNGGSGSPTNCLINGAACSTGSGGGGGGGGDTTAPSAPGNLHSTGTTSSSVSLAWNASTDNVGVTGYLVYQGGTQVATATGTSATVSGLAASTSYTFTVKARDAANNVSAASNAVTVTTPSGGGGGGGGGGTTLPVAPYIDMGSWPTPVLTDVATASTLKSFTLAFITSAGCHASWFNAYDPRSGWQLDQINALRARGGDVKISFGGASGIELAQACSSVSALTAEYQAVINAYSLNYIDFDIEGAAVAEPNSISLRTQAMKALQTANPNLKISLTLPVLPTGLDANGLNVVRSAVNAGVNLDIVNIMAMDYYQSGDYGDFAVQAAQSTYNQLAGLYPGRTSAQLWRMVGVTPMLGQNDDGHVYDKSDASQLVTFAKANHLGELAFWEVTRDRNACTGALYMCTNIAQSPYDFSKIFAGYTG